MKVLFVCSGNTCRSPMAEALIRKEAACRGMKGHHFQSAGLSAMPGDRASRYAVEAMSARGLDIDRRPAQQVDAEMVMRADIVLAMTAELRQLLQENLPQHASKIKTVGEFVGTDTDVNDPYSGDSEEYELVASQLEELMGKVLDNLK